MTDPGDRSPDDAPSDTVPFSRPGPGMPSRIGRYAIQGVIASGGMGTVYKAVQENPRRVVAVKVMRSGVNTATDLRRFEFEAQLLGRLRHPGIAQIYEAGTQSDGGVSVPYFAMEYIPNAKDLIQYTRDKKLGIRERLELFARIADAVHHGHQRGIIHRDLKPGNILVGPDGNPKIIDFGVARATDSDMALTQFQTGLGQLVGTIQYMSPEQCEADPHDIDTRSDVYSLGIVLYELLTGALPYDITRVPTLEATRVIRNQEPLRPSKVDPKLRGDLETVVLKALEKDRDRRYQSAAELGQDVRRYLAGDAITARPVSSVYQLRVFARRNKGLLTGIGAVAAALVVGVIVSSVLYVRSRSFQLEAQKQEAKVRGAQDYLQDITAALEGVMGDEVPVSNLLEIFGKNIEERFADQPEVEADVRLSLAQSYDYLTMFRGSSEGKLYAERAEENFDRALELRRALYGEHDPKTLTTMEETAEHLGQGFDLERAERLFRETLRIWESSAVPDSDQIMGTREALAGVLITRGNLDEAEPLIDDVLGHVRVKYGKDSPEALFAQGQRAWLHQLRGRFAEAERDRREALEGARRRFGTGSDEETTALRNLANLCVAEGKVDDAAAIYDVNVALTSETLRIKKWLGRERQIRPGAPTLLIFWESWCPYCQLFLPKLDTVLPEEGSPLQVIGMTSLSGGMHEDDAESFVERNSLGFDNAVYERRARKELQVGGFPTVLAVSGGRVVWKGHPNQVTPAFVDGLIRGEPTTY